MTTDNARHPAVTARTGLWSCLLLLCLAHAPAQAREPTPGIYVREARSWLSEDVYQLQARVDYVLSRPVRDALVSGLPLVMELQVEVVRDYFGFWNHTVASLSQYYQLRYHALSRQYLLRNLNSGAQRSFPTEQDALDALGAIDLLPLLDRRLLEDGVHYDGRMRVRLDIDSLPTPLRLAAWFDADWRLASEWYTWPLKP